jgi:hypothetical protein
MVSIFAIIADDDMNGVNLQKNNAEEVKKINDCIDTTNSN